MSLWSIIAGNSSSSQSSSPYVNSTYTAALAKIEGDSSGATAAAPTTAGDDNGVSISADAQAAASEADDNQMSFSDLADTVRSSLDTLYSAEQAAGKPQSASFANLSGRALSAVVLNQGNQFTPTEQQQAKAALDQQTRDAFTAATSGGMSMGSLSTYSQSLVTQYDAMSPEERQARGWNETFRDNAAKVVSEGSLSLFDQVDSSSSSSSAFGF